MSADSGLGKGVRESMDSRGLKSINAGDQLVMERREMNTECLAWVTGWITMLLCIS